MDLELKKRWVEALRSGNYKQVRKVLKSKDGYCCLGVLRHLINPEDDTGFMHPVDLVNQAVLLSEEQLAGLGLSDDDQRHLASLNDAGRTFDEIADHIERMSL